MQGSSYIPQLSALPHSPISSKLNSTKSLTGSFLFDQQQFNDSNKNQNNKRIQFDPINFNIQNQQKTRANLGVPNLNNPLEVNNQAYQEFKNQYLQTNQNLNKDVQINRFEVGQEAKNANISQKKEYLIKRLSHIQDNQSNPDFTNSPQALKSKKLYYGNQERLKCIHQKTNDDCNCTSCQVKQLYNKLVKYNDQTNNTPSNKSHNIMKETQSNYYGQEINQSNSPTKKTAQTQQKFSFYSQVQQQKPQYISQNDKQPNFVNQQKLEDQRQNQLNKDNLIKQQSKQSFLISEQYQIKEITVKDDQNRIQTNTKNINIGLQIPLSPSKQTLIQNQKNQDQSQKSREEILSSMYEQNTELQQLVQEQQTYIQLLYNQMTQYQNILDVNKIPYSQNNIQMNENSLLNPAFINQSPNFNYIFQSPRAPNKLYSDEKQSPFKQNIPRLNLNPQNKNTLSINNQFFSNNVGSINQLSPTKNNPQNGENQFQFLNVLNNNIPSKQIIIESIDLHSDQHLNVGSNLQTTQQLNSDYNLKSSYLNKNISNSYYNEQQDNNIDKQSNLLAESNLYNNYQKIDQLNNIDKKLQNIKKHNSDIYTQDSQQFYVQENQNNFLLEKSLRAGQNRSQSIHSNNQNTNSFLDKQLINDSDMSLKTGSGNQKSTSLSSRQQNSKSIHSESQKSTKNNQIENQNKNEFFRENLDLKFIDPSSKIISNNNNQSFQGSKLDLEMKQFKQRFIKFLKNVSIRENKRKGETNDLNKLNINHQHKLIQNITRQSNFMTPQSYQQVQHKKQIEENKVLNPNDGQQRHNNQQQIYNFNLLLDQSNNRNNSLDKYLKNNH